ncbi:hypothetical protein [Xanthomonas axonopodis]|uniref:hypothetical protein n=1 Tax=Xanthomonas axonopodis TaxID=53413 RepID=UPI000B27CEE9|nr:hypothetical protein [Xanthomonas axonopodis]QKD85280.1 hypothetical protein XAV_00810 [Xanthomonas axonopodis pv. vasculorum]
MRKGSTCSCRRPRRARPAELGDAEVIRFRQVVIDATQRIVPPSNAFGPCLERQPRHQINEGKAVEGYVWEPVSNGARTAACR